MPSVFLHILWVESIAILSKVILSKVIVRIVIEMYQKVKILRTPKIYAYL